MNGNCIPQSTAQPEAAALQTTHCLCGSGRPALTCHGLQQEAGCTGNPSSLLKTRVTSSITSPVPLSPDQQNQIKITPREQCSEPGLTHGKCSIRYQLFLLLLSMTFKPLLHQCGLDSDSLGLHGGQSDELHPTLQLCKSTPRPRHVHATSTPPALTEPALSGFLVLLWIVFKVLFHKNEA